MTAEGEGDRPCRYCVAMWRAWAVQRDALPAILPSAEECEWHHERLDQPTIDLAVALARVYQSFGRRPSDAQIGEMLGDASAVVENGGFDPLPDTWKVRRLPTGGRVGEFDARMRINDVTFVCQAAANTGVTYPVRLSTYRAWQRGEDA